jgi:CRISPR-associated endonuclease Csn1
MTPFLRFAFDMGTNSIGWAVLEGRYPDGVISARQGGAPGSSGALVSVKAAGVRIFSDGRNPKDGQSLAVMRRGPRAARRRRDRFLQRQRGLDRLLTLYGLFPSNEGEAAALAVLDPLQLRAEGLTRTLTLHEFGRAIWHLNQRRGFKSNRKTDGGDKDSGVIKTAAAALAETLVELDAETLGAWLWMQKKSGARIRFAPTGEGKERYRFYPTREMVEAEFDLLWARQATKHPADLTETAREAIRSMIFRQRPLKKPPVGKCTFVPGELRAPKALPSVEARDIYERLNQLRWGRGPITDQYITREVRDLLAGSLLSGKGQTWDKVRKLMREPDARFNLEDWLKELPVSKTAARMRKADAFGERWLAMSLTERDRVIQRFVDMDDEDELAAWLVAEHGFAAETAAKVAASSTPGADGYGKLGVTANAAILQQLIADHKAVYSDAVQRAGWHHSDFRTGEVRDDLPYYGEVLERHVIDSDPDLRAAAASFLADLERNAGRSDGKTHARRFAGAGLAEAQTGRVPNPTVHIGLNQLRLVVSALVKAHGPPDEVVLELARDLKLTKEQKEKSNQENRKNRDENERRAKAITELGQPVNGETMMRARLFDAQKAAGIVQCPYTLRTISFAEAIGGGEIEVDHIIPFSLSFDDGIANKVLCRIEANRRKGRRTPHEAFGHDANWPAIMAHAEALGRNRAWRFAPDALERFSKQGGFLERQLNETRHLARLAKAYLEVLTPNVWVVTGQLTALLRGKWGLNGILGDDNRKNRNDHRHHAADAIVIGCTSRGLLNEVAKVASRAEEQNLDRLFGDFPEPMPNFRDQAVRAVRAGLVSPKPEHGKGGALHEDTAYGLNVRPEERDLGNVVMRKALDAITVKEVDRIRDKDLRAQLQSLRDQVGGDQKRFTAAARAWALEEARAWAAANPGKPARQPIRRVRLLKPEAALIPIEDRDGRAYKGLVPAENAFVDIVKMRDGTWKGFGASIFEINRKGWRPVWEVEKLGGLLVMRLRKGDLVELQDPDGERRIKRVVQIEASNNRMRLATIHEGGRLQDRHDLPEDQDGFRWDLANFGKLRDRGARQVIVDTIGSCKS